MYHVYIYARRNRARYVCKDWMTKIDVSRNDFTLKLSEDPFMIDYQNPAVQRHVLDFAARNAKMIKKVYIHCNIPTTVLQEILQTLAQHNKLSELHDSSMRVFNLEDLACLHKLRKLQVRDSSMHW